MGVAIIITVLIGLLTVLWEMRYDIEFMRVMFSFEQKQLDLEVYFRALYVSLFAMLLFARLRWKQEYGKGGLIILALIFWVLAAIPFMLLSPGDFAH